MLVAMQSKGRWITSLAIVLAIGQSATAQTVGAVRGWFSMPGCISDVATESTTDGWNHESDGSVSLASRARAISDSLPQGSAKELAQQLAQSLAPRTSLRYVCKQDSGEGYLVRYPEGLGTEFQSDTEFVEFPYEKWNLGSPEIAFDVSFSRSSNTFVYSYQVSNGTQAARAISMWKFVTMLGDKDLQLDDLDNWNGAYFPDSDPVAPQAALYEDLGGPELLMQEPLGRLASWGGSSDGIEPGETIGAFTARSSLRPGWTTAHAVSIPESIGIPLLFDELPAAVREELLFLERWENLWSSLPIIGPRFGPDAERSEIAGNWQTGIEIVIRHGWLAGDSPYVRELLQFLKDPTGADLSVSLKSGPAAGMEAHLDKIVRMAFAAPLP